MKRLVQADWIECPNCGDVCQVLTDVNNPDNYYNDEDDVICADCGAHGIINIMVGCAASVSWDDE